MHESSDSSYGEDKKDTKAASSQERGQEHAQTYTGAAKEQINKAKEEGKARLEQQKHYFAGEIDGIVNALRSSVAQLQGQEQATAAGYVDRAADGLETTSPALQEQDFAALVGQTEEFARRQPGVFFGGAVATGFLLARFLKSSRKRVSTPSRAQDDEYSAPVQAGGSATAEDLPPSSTTAYP